MTWSNVRRATYTYYGPADLHGTTGDLRSAQLEDWEDGAWAETGTSLYRYWLPAGSGSSSSGGTHKGDILLLMTWSAMRS